ncbi:MAG: acyltransferase family protein [Thermodesulfobacteriota bacterium]
MEKTTNPERRLFFLDWVRSVAILLIINAHFNDMLREYGIPAHVFHSNPSGLGVSLFITLSGASLMAAYGKDLGGVSSFFWKRFLTIFPLFWLCYLLFYVALSVQGGTFPPMQGNPLKYLLTLTGFDGFFLYKASNFYLIGEWFLGLIILFYLSFPLLRHAVLAMGYWVLPCSLLLMVIAAHLHNIWQVEMGANRFPPSRLMEFIWGMTLVWYFCRQDVTWKERWRFLAAAAATFTGIYFFLKPAWLMPHILAGLAAFPILALLAWPLGSGAMQSLTGFVSKYSYGAFLVHHQFLAFLFAFTTLPRYLFREGSLYPVFFAYVTLVFMLSYLVTQCCQFAIGRLRGRKS